MKKQFYLLWSLLFWLLQAQGQHIVPTIKLDSSRVSLGESFAVELQLSHPSGTVVQWPVWLDSLAGLEVLQLEEVDTLQTDDESTMLRSQRLRLISFDSGHVIIPPVFFKFVSASGKTDSVGTDPLEITILTTPVDTTKAIRDIKPVQELPFDFGILLWIGLGLVLVSVLIWWFVRKLKARKIKEPVRIEIAVPAHQLALQELKQLELEGLWQQGQVKAYHTRLTDIIRTYMEHRWKISAMELTTDEVLQQSIALAWNADLREGMERILRLADLVKFAKYQPLADEHTWSMQEAVRFVHSTAPIVNSGATESRTITDGGGSHAE